MLECMHKHPLTNAQNKNRRKLETGSETPFELVLIWNDVIEHGVHSQSRGPGMTLIFTGVQDSGGKEDLIPG